MPLWSWLQPALLSSILPLRTLFNPRLCNAEAQKPDAPHRQPLNQSCRSSDPKQATGRANGGVKGRMTGLTVDRWSWVPNKRRVLRGSFVLPPSTLLLTPLLCLLFVCFFYPGPPVWLHCHGRNLFLFPANAICCYFRKRALATRMDSAYIHKPRAQHPVLGSNDLHVTSLGSLIILIQNNW